MEDQPPSRRASRTPSPISLEALAQRAMDGDDEAFEQLHQRLRGGLHAFFSRRLGGPSARLEELVHGTWIEVWKSFRLRRYDPNRARLTTFVYAIGNNVLLRSHRAEGRDRLTFPGVDDELHRGQAEHPAFDHLLHQSELIDAVRDCLRRRSGPDALSEQERAIVQAATAGASERELAARLNLAPSTINARKRVALQKLRKCLSIKGFGDAAVEQDLAGGE